MKTVIPTILLFFVVAGVVPVAEGIQVEIFLNDSTTSVLATPDIEPCEPPAGGSCSVFVDIPFGDFPDSDFNSVTIFEGGQGTADAVDGSGNKMSVSNFVFLYNGSGPGTVRVVYRHKFINVNTNTTSGRQYAHNATGNFCRVDPDVGCLTADGDAVRLTSTATLEEGGGSTAIKSQDVGLGLGYSVEPGAVNNNDFNPDKFSPLTQGDPIPIKCPFTKGRLPNCEPYEIIQSELKFTVQPNDAVLLLASPQALSGPNTAVVQNLLNTNQKIDVQPSGLTNNDYNGGDNGRIWVEALAGEGFNPCSVAPNTVGLSIGRSDFVSPVGQVQDDFNTDGTCAGRRFQFSTTDLFNAGADREACLKFPVAVLAGSAQFTSSFTPASTGGGKGKKGGSSAPLPPSCKLIGNEVVCTEDLDWSGSQVVKCSVPS